MSEVRLTALEAAITNITAKMEADVAGNAGAMTTGYDAFVSDAGVAYTVTNLKEYGVKFTDLKGSVFVLGRASGPDAVVTAYGLSPELQALVSDAIVTAVPA